MIAPLEVDSRQWDTDDPLFHVIEVSDLENPASKFLVPADPI